MPIQALITHLSKADVTSRVAAIDGGSEVLEVVDSEGGTCLVRSTTHAEADDAEKSRVAGMIQTIADADSALIRAAAESAPAPEPDDG